MLSDGLDADGRRFLKFGPRTPAERLAFAQRVAPGAHASATLAPQRAQAEFQASGRIDQARHFVGLDGAVYMRTAGMEEPLAARLRRGMESAVGGFPGHPIEDSLAELGQVAGGLSDDVLAGDSGTDALDGYASVEGRYDPATAAKIADNQAFNQPQSAYELAVRDFLRAQRINPAAWQMAEPLPEDAQKTFQDNGYQIWAAIAPFAFVGPDGVLYRKNEYTREDPGSAKIRVFNWLQQQAKAAEEPPPDPVDVFWKAVAAGQFLPGTQYRGAVPPAFRGQVPQVPTQPVQPVPIQNRSGGRRGSAETRSDLEQQVQTLRRLNPRQTHRDGSRRDGEEVAEEYIPNPAGQLLGDGREKSIRPDATFVDPRGTLSRIEHADVTRFGKPTLKEDAKAQREFRWTHSNGYNVPQSNVYVILKRHQLERIENRHKRTPRKKKDDEGRDN
jgi:hypothetical protein